jgi:type I restriction enzyme S subunit
VKIQDGTHFSPAMGGSEYRYITSRNIGGGRLRLDSVEMISESEHRKIYGRCDTRFGDLLLTKDGANTGNAAINPFTDEISLLSSVAFIRANHRLATEAYLLQYILSRPGRKQIEDAMAGNAITRLTLAKIKALQVSLPNVDEQQRIATALGEIDDLISYLERFITKKQAIQQGMMQELLTGRTRLPGFDGTWSEVGLGTIASVTMGQSPAGSSYNSDGRGIPLVQGNADIRDRFTVDRVWTTTPTKVCEAGDVILTVRAPVGYTAIASRASCLGRGVCALSAKADNRFLFHALIYVEPSWALYEQGSTFTAVNSNEVRSFKLPWPADRRERGAIAQVLDDTEGELRILEFRLEKARAIKQGMMQELLTGRTRLPGTGAVA